MNRGDVVADRFEIESLAGRGGMGVVYRARDRETGQIVALKMLHEQDGVQPARFTREAEVLAELSHPGIVSYVAYGRAKNALYLAMEWLEGESLSERLRRQNLNLEEARTFALHVAEALSAAHRRGIVHRDIKPSNLFLVDGSVDRIRVLDFGIAQLGARRGRLTLTGAILGTPGYMAPEQARGDPVDCRADVFALGCVLFKCLTGKTAFSGDDGLAVLIRVVLEEAPRVRDLRPEVPRALDELVGRMLAKSPNDRPADAGVVASELAAIGSLSGRSAEHVSVSPPALTNTERRMICLILARVAHVEHSEAPTQVMPPKDDSTASAVESAPFVTQPFELHQSTMQLEPGSVTLVEVAPQLTDWAKREAALTGIVDHYGGKLNWLADGSLVVTVDTSGAATDHAVRAAHCALEMRPLLPETPLSLVAGNAVLSRRLPIGEVIDRAVALLDRSSGEVIRLDEVVAGLLDARFDIGGDAGGLYLKGRREVTNTARTLLGRPSPCVGREREIASLEAIFEECVAEPIARAVLVTAEAGVGKSRLRYEFISKLKDRGEPVEIWFARGDPMSAGSPFGMIARSIQDAAGVLDGEPLAVQQRKLRARVGRHLDPQDRSRITEFLGELVGARFDDKESVQLRAARKDSILLGDQMLRAWEDWLAAECSAQPVLVVLEDLQWGDLPSVRFIDSALRNLRDRPWLVLSFGRPEVHQLFPSIWAGRAITEVHLGDLTKRGSEKLVRAVLGDDLPSQTVSLLVERAAGNAFYLEELIRAVVDGRGAALPETVLAMVQARLDGLPADARRALRAGSIFGQTFWQGGVATLLGGTESNSQLPAWLATLCDAEVISRRVGGKFPDEGEHIFRHDLLREAAYAMLTESDRTLGHQLAGEWLEQAGERDALVLAEHFERGNQPARALTWYRRAAEHALEGDDFVAANQRAERALACGATGEARGALRLLQAEAHSWRGENKDAETCASEAMQLLARGSAPWYNAAAQLAVASGRLANTPQLEALAIELGASHEGEGSGPHIIAAARTTMYLLYAGSTERAEALFTKIETYESQFADRDPLVLARYNATRSVHALISGDPGAALSRHETSLANFEQAGDRRSACATRVSVGFTYIELGDFAEAERVLRDALATAERMGLSSVSALAKENLGLALAYRGHLDEAKQLEVDAIDAFVIHKNGRLEGGARVYLALILMLSGDLRAAEEEGRRAVEVSSVTGPGHAQALGMLAHVLHGAGNHLEALGVAKEAMQMLESLGAIDEGEALVRRVFAETLSATGDYDGARKAIGTAQARLLARAAKIADPRWRQSFLERVPDNVRTLALAREWSS